MLTCRINPEGAQMQRKDALVFGLGALVTAALVVSGIDPYDRLTWWMEVLPAMLALVIIGATHRRFPLTELVLVLIAIHALILILGGAYTYARVPLGFWLQDAFGFERNPYDRIGHLAQGFIPAMIARELLIRRKVLARGGAWLFFVVCSICLAISALYELIEWQAAVIMGQGATEFLGTQGDPWDTQADMALALIGSILAQWLLARWHDRQLQALSA